MVIQTTKQCACRWILRHQHKLRQQARSCHLKVKELLIGNEDARDCDPEYSFKANDSKITLAEPHQLRKKPNVDNLKFGQIFTDHMLKIFYHKALGGWQTPEIIPFENISLHPAAKVLHYAIELFEGMKAYRGVDGRIRVFRPDLNMQRMNLSAKESGLPTFDGPELIKCMNKLICIDQEWVPHSEASSLYIRPTLIGIDGTLGVSQSESALLFTILCPVGAYFSGDNDAVTLFADPTYTRAWPGGCGDRKMGSNYGPTIRVQQQAAMRGKQQVLWLYGDDHQLTEVGTMNIFVFYINEKGKKVLATPPLNGLILPGITRYSILQLVRDWNEFEVEERVITMKDIMDMQNEDRLLEIFGSGTACVVSPVKSIEFLGQDIQVPTIEHSDPVFRRLSDTLTGIQYGRIQDHPWAPIVGEI